MSGDDARTVDEVAFDLDEERFGPQDAVEETAPDPYVARALESAQGHSAWVRVVDEGVEAGTMQDPDGSWLRALRAEEVSRWDRLAAAMVEAGELLPDAWPAEDRAQFDRARDRFMRSLMAGNPKRLAEMVRDQAAAGGQA